jgi:glycosyltransferase involved in cell wall biosynthesis
VHVGFLCNEYPPLPAGGIGTSVQNLARGLVDLGHRVTVVGWHARGEAFDDGGVRVIMVPESRVPRTGWLINRLRARAALARLVREEALDILEVPDWVGPGAGIRPGCPVVVRCHGTATYFGHLTGEAVRPSVRWAEALTFRGADALGAVSRFTADVTTRLFGLSRPFQVLYNGLDTERFTPGDAPASREPTVLYFGTLVRKKGVLDLPAIFSRVVELWPDVCFALLGRDSRDRRTGSASTWALLRDALSPAARERTEYLGRLPPDEVAAHVARAAVCVFPSYAEAFPMAWLEAMACASPLVAYDIGWARESVEDGVSGVLVPPGDAGAVAREVTALLADAGRRAVMGAAARRRVETLFSTEAVARRSMDWYRSTLEAHRAR